MRILNVDLIFGAFPRLNPNDVQRVNRPMILFDAYYSLFVNHFPSRLRFSRCLLGKGVASMA